MGEIDYLARNVFRFALYSDEIFIVDPFHKPHALQNHFNPLVRPEEFKADTLSVLYFLMEIGPWVRNGLVTLIPSRGDFDFQLRDQSAKAAEERLKSLHVNVDEILEDGLSSPQTLRIESPESRIGTKGEGAIPWRYN